MQYSKTHKLSPTFNIKSINILDKQSMILLIFLMSKTAITVSCT